MVFYVLICILVVIGHNVKSIQSYLNLNSNFSLGGHIIHYLDVALTKVLGVSRTNDVGPILFWIIIGLLVYSFAQSTIQLIIEPVSYTHLDVYKRQNFYSVMSLY